MANDSMLKRSGDIIKGAFAEATKDYTSSVVETTKEITAGIDTIRAQASKYHLNPNAILKNFKFSAIHKNVNDWFYGRISDDNDSGDDDFSSATLGGGGFDSDDDDGDKETSVMIADSPSKSSMKKLNDNLVSNLHSIGAKQVEANMANTAELVSSIGSIYKLMENDYLNPMKNSLANIEKIVQKTFDVTAAAAYSQQRSTTTSDASSILNSDGMLNIGALINNGFKSITEAISGFSFNPKELLESFTPEKLLGSAIKRGFQKIEIDDRSLDEWGRGFNQLFKEVSQNIASDILFAIDENRGGVGALRLGKNKYEVADVNDYTRDKAMFDMMTRKTIVEIIPDYLKKITESLTGQSYSVDTYGKLTTHVTDRFKEEVQWSIGRFGSGISSTTFTQLAQESSVSGREASSDDFSTAADAMVRYMTVRMHFAKMRVLDYKIARNMDTITVEDNGKSVPFVEYVARKLAQVVGDADRTYEFWYDVCDTIALRISTNASECSTFVQQCNKHLAAMVDTANKSVTDYRAGGVITYSDVDETLKEFRLTDDSSTESSVSTNPSATSVFKTSSDLMNSINNAANDIFGILNRGINVRVTGNKPYDPYQRTSASTTTAPANTGTGLSAADYEIFAPNVSGGGSSGAGGGTSQSESTSGGVSGSSTTSGTATGSVKRSGAAAALTEREKRDLDTASALREKLGSVVSGIKNPNSIINGGIGKVVGLADSAIFGKVVEDPETGERIRSGGFVNSVADRTKQFATDIGFTDFVDRKVSQGKEFATNAYNKAHNKALDTRTNLEIAGLRSKTKREFGGTADNIYAQEALSLMQIALMDGDGTEDTKSIDKVIDKIEDPELKESIREQMNTMLERNSDKAEHAVTKKHSKNPIIGLLGVGVKIFVKPVVTLFKTLISTILGIGKKIIKLVTYLITSGAKDVVTGAGSVVSGAFDVIKTPFSLVKSAAGGVKNGISTKIKQGLTGSDATGDELEKAYRQKLDALSKATDGISNGIKSLNVRLKFFAAGILDGSWLGKIFTGENSIFKKIGNSSFFTGLAEGLGIKKKKATSEVLSNMAPETKVESDLQKTKEFVGDIANDFKDLINIIRNKSDSQDLGDDESDDSTVGDLSLGGGGSDSQDATAGSSSDTTTDTSATTTSTEQSSNDATVAPATATDTSTSNDATATSTTTTVNNNATTDSSTAVSGTEDVEAGEETSRGGKIVGALKGAGSKMLGGIGKMLGGGIKILLGIGKILLGFVTGLTAFKTLTKLVQDMINTGIKPLERGINSVINAIKPHIKPFGEIIGMLAGSLSDVIESVVESITPLLKILVPTVSTMFDTVIGPMLEDTSEVLSDVIAPMIEDSLPTIVTVLSGMSRLLKGATGVAQVGLGSILKGIGQIIAVVGHIAGSDKAEEKGADLFQTGQSLVQKGKGNITAAFATDSPLTKALKSQSLVDEAEDNYKGAYTKSQKSFTGSPLDGTNVLVGNGDFKQSNYGTSMGIHGCGPASLSERLSSAYGMSLSPLQIASMFGSGNYYDSSKGMSVAGYINAANALGMNLTPGGVTVGSLRGASLHSPITLLGSGQAFGTSDGNNHYINVYGSDGHRAVVANPLTGRYETKSVSSLLNGSVLGLYGNGDNKFDTRLAEFQSEYGDVIDTEEGKIAAIEAAAHETRDAYNEEYAELEDQYTCLLSGKTVDSHGKKIEKTESQLRLAMSEIDDNRRALGILMAKDIESTDASHLQELTDLARKSRAYEIADVLAWIVAPGQSAGSAISEKITGKEDKLRDTVLTVIADKTTGNSDDIIEDVTGIKWYKDDDSSNFDQVAEDIANTDENSGIGSSGFLNAISPILNQLKEMASNFIEVFTGGEDEASAADLDQEIKDLFYDENSSDPNANYNAMVAKVYEIWSGVNPQRDGESDAQYQARFEAVKPSLLVQHFGQVIEQQRRYKETGSYESINANGWPGSKGAFISESGAVLATDYEPQYTDVDITGDKYNGRKDWSQHSPIHDFFIHKLHDDTFRSEDCNWFSQYCSPDKEGVGSSGGTHQGVDFHTDTDNNGTTPLYATTDGKVTRIDYDSSGGGGHYVEWEDVGGYTHRYMHMNHQSPTVVGDTVKGGQTIMGYIGNSGTTSSAYPQGVWHLHYDIRKGGYKNYQNPLTYFKYNPNYRSSGAGKKATDIPANFTVNEDIGNNENVEKVWNYLMDNGWSAVAAAGIMGNWFEESDLYTDRLGDDIPRNSGTYIDGTRYTSTSYTDAVNKGAIDRRTFADVHGGSKEIGYGLAQWTDAGRKNNLYAHMKSNTNPFDISNFDTQMEFAIDELKTSYKDYYDTFLANPQSDHSNLEAGWDSSISHFSDWGLEKYEIPDNIEGNKPERRSNAWSIYKLMTGSGDTEIPPLDTSKLDEFYEKSGLNQIRESASNNIFVSKVDNRMSIEELAKQTFEVKSESIERLLREIINKINSTGSGVTIPDTTNNTNMFEDEVPANVTRLYK